MDNNISRYELIKTISLVLLILSGVSTTLSFVTNFNSVRAGSPVVILGIGAFLSYAIIYFWLRKPLSPAMLEVVVHALVICSLTVSWAFQFVIPSIRPASMVLPILLVITSLPGSSRWLFMILNGCVLLTTIIIADDTSSKLWVSTNWMICYCLLCWGIIAFARRLDQARSLAEAQAARLGELLGTLNSSTEVGASLSHQLSNVTNELNITSRQQASSTQEQVAAVTQVTASLEELSETANQIAASAAGAARSAQQTVLVAVAVKESREESLSVADEGTAAVSQTVESVGQVRNRIELMGQRLLNLTEQTRRVGSIIDIIDEITDETHLLALNASIEAAGSIMGSGSAETSVERSNRGERFGVIAQEIKNLSERSRESTEEVRQAIQEMQGAVAASVLVAEEGKKATSQALLRSQIAGAVINKLNDLIDGSSRRFDEILVASEEVKQRCDEISVATGQQRSANQQIVSTMRGVAQVARESAGIVTELSSKALKVNEQVEQLNAVLANTSEISTTSPHKPLLKPVALAV